MRGSVFIFAISIAMVCILVTCCIMPIDFLLSFLNPLFPLLRTVIWHPIRISIFQVSAKQRNFHFLKRRRDHSRLTSWKIFKDGESWLINRDPVSRCGSLLVRKWHSFPFNFKFKWVWLKVPVKVRNELIYPVSYIVKMVKHFCVNGVFSVNLLDFLEQLW